jgi:hypothetical protein
LTKINRTTCFNVIYSMATRYEEQQKKADKDRIVIHEWLQKENEHWDDEIYNENKKVLIKLERLSIDICIRSWIGFMKRA